MLKPFCDICKLEITEKNRGLDENKMSIPIMVGFPEPLELRLNLIGVHICKYCISNGFKALDDRPKAEPEACCK